MHSEQKFERAFKSRQRCRKALLGLQTGLLILFMLLIHSALFLVRFCFTLDKSIYQTHSCRLRGTWSVPVDSVAHSDLPAAASGSLYTTNTQSQSRAADPLYTADSRPDTLQGRRMGAWLVHIACYFFSYPCKYRGIALNWDKSNLNEQVMCKQKRVRNHSIISHTIIHYCAHRRCSVNKNNLFIMFFTFTLTLVLSDKRREGMFSATDSRLWLH